MANLNKLTGDEQLILIHYIQSRLSIEALSQITGTDLNTIHRDICLGAADKIASISDSEAREVIKIIRYENAEGAERAARDNQTNNN